MLMKMTKETKIIMGILALGGAYLVYRYFKKPPPTIGGSTSAADTKPKNKTDDYPLKRGSKGAMVGLLQQALGGKKTLPKFGVDNDFGSETEAAVKKFLNKTTVDTFDEIVKIAGLNNLAYDSNKKKFFTPQGGTTVKVSDVLAIKK
jgi:peptidoglycan hydrolase-like protein with peptidoglycan-binding domain